VLSEDEAPDLKPGEVLVAPVLDAAYGPLLAAAAGAVAEIGGLLSHGAVVARELGVPCVVDVRDATRRLRTGDVVLVDGGSGRVTVLPDGGSAALPHAALTPAREDDEAFHALEPHPLARESVYFNARDPASGAALVASLGVRSGQRGEAVLVVSLPDGRVLSGLDLAAPRTAARGLSVGASSIGWSPARLAFDGRLAAFEASSFPPGPIPLFAAPRTVAVSLDLEFVPTTPAFDLALGLAPEVKAALRPLGSHHVEQSGRWRGELRVDGRRFSFDGAGGRDHSWGLRDWEAADHWRLFTLSLAPDLAVHALVVSVRGRLVEGGFLWRDGRALGITRVRYATERRGDKLAAFSLEVSATEGSPLVLHGRVLETLRIPVQLARSPLRHLQGRPYRMILQENFTRYEALGQVGHGMAEFTQR
jgi:phosphohistidine swiveling domain-containing protein